MTATKEQADKLALLGYKLESAESSAKRLGEEGREQYYSTTGQQLKAAGEGLLRGASLGGTDYLFGDEDTAARQQYNPGIALGTEIVGGIAPMLASGGTSAVGQIAARTPAALAARAGAAVGKATGLGRYGAAAVAAGVEGGIVGATSAANQAYLADDDLTAETVFHGLGFGAVFGAGAGVLGAKFLSAGENAAARLGKQADNAVDAEFRMAGPTGQLESGGTRLLPGEVMSDVHSGRAGAPQGQLGGKVVDQAAVDDFLKNTGVVPRESQTWYGGPEGLTNDPYRRAQPLLASGDGVVDDFLTKPRAEAVTPVTTESAERAAAYASAAEAEATEALSQAKSRAQAFVAGGADTGLGNFETQMLGADLALSGSRREVANTEVLYNKAYQTRLDAAGAAQVAKRNLEASVSPLSRAVKTADPAYQALSSEVTNIAGRFVDANAAAENVLATMHAKLMAVTADSVPGMTKAKMALVKRQLTVAFKGIKEAGAKGSPALKQKALASYTKAMETSAEVLGIRTAAATQMLDMVATVGEAGRVLKTFPKSVDGFAKLAPDKAERLFGAIEAAKAADLYPELTQALDAAAVNLAEAAGLKVTGTDGLRQTWTALQAAAAAEKAAPIAAVTPAARKKLEQEVAKATEAFEEARKAEASLKDIADRAKAGFGAAQERAQQLRTKIATEWEAGAKAAQADAAEKLKVAESVLEEAQKVAAKDAAAAAAAEKKSADLADAARKRAEKEAGKAQTEAAKKAEARARQAERQAESRARWESSNARKAAEQSRAKAEKEAESVRKAQARADQVAENEARRARQARRQADRDAWAEENRAYRQERRADQAERQADRDAAKAEREADRAARQAERDAERAGKAPGFVGAVGAVTGHAAMGGYTGAMAGRAVANSAWEALAALKLRGISRLNAAAATYFPKAGKAITLVGPKIEPLSRKLDGTTETAKKSREALAGDRLKELWNAYGAVNDTLYEGVAQLSGEQPALMAKMHALGANAFRELLRGTPRDPGTVSGLKSIWGPSPLQAIRLGRQLEVFHDPIGEYERMLTTGSFDPIGVKMLKAAAPALYQEGRSLLLARLGEGNLLESMSYPDQIALSTMLELDIHSSMRPEHIASSQALHLARKEPMEMPIKPAGSAGGRPPSGSSDATASQQITAH